MSNTVLYILSSFILLQSIKTASIRRSEHLSNNDNQIAVIKLNVTHLVHNKTLIKSTKASLGPKVFASNSPSKTTITLVKTNLPRTTRNENKEVKTIFSSKLSTKQTIIHEITTKWLTKIHNLSITTSNALNKTHSILTIKPSETSTKTLANNTISRKLFDEEILILLKKFVHQVSEWANDDL